MSPRLTDITEAVETMAEATELAMKKHGERLEAVKAENATLLGRIEDLEARANVVRSNAPSGGNGSPSFKRYETSQGPVYEIPAGTKMADAIRPEKAAPVSFDRWLTAAMVGDRCGDKDALDFARERKDVATTSTGVLIPAEYQSDWIDLIRSQSVLNAAGMTTVTMDAKTTNWSAVTADPTAEWHSEAGSITPSDPTFAARVLTAKTLAVVCTTSVEVAQDSPNFGQQLAGVMARAMAVELDRVGLIGTGTPPEPKGILGTSGVNTVSGAAVTNYAKIIEAVSALLVDNIPLDVATRNWIMSPAIWAKFEGLATGISSDKTQLPRPRSLEASNFLISTHGLDMGSPPTSTIFGGDFSDLVLGVRREASVEALKLTTYGTNLQLSFVGYLRADYLVRRPSSLVTITGVPAV